MKPLKIYVDTSVFGGCFDREFEKYSLNFFKMVKKHHISLLISDVVIQELNRAPVQVQNVLRLLPQDMLEPILLTEEAVLLRDAYLKKRILNKKSMNDATHVALATINRADAIVSWNFKHIVRLDHMKAFNNVNFSLGYGVLVIVSPREVFLDQKII
ncbi:MAG: hypothetical protein HQM16_10670 [Deltaproteobacteria bacterium]|nr:hypothetical protein [Deltaproteobacteria bacterium]